jgi:phosphoglycerate dehydrogenase-like enzyme
MSSQKQILILEDLGIPMDNFEKITSQSELAYDFVHDDLISANIEGIITVKTTVDQQLIEKYPNLKFIAVAFTGYDCVDLDICKKKNISVFNVPAYSTNSVAELAVGLAISLLREIPKATNIVQSGKWNLNPGFELSGKKIGILGTGEIGTTTAKYFKTFGCEIIGWSRSEREEFKKYGTYTNDLIELFSNADIVSIHLPLNEITKGMVGEKELSSMKSNAYIINAARGPIIDKNALYKVLNKEKIAGAAIDVFDQEPLETDNPFLQLSNIILTPHIAYKTVEALNRRAQITIDNIVHFAKGKPLNLVN